MRELTQTVTCAGDGPIGNCWQTAVACVLDVDPDALPAQAAYDWRRTREDGTVERGPGYWTPLQAYLRTHHGLAYVEMHYPPEVLACLRIADPGALHLMTGTTVRSAALGGLRHVVVARNGACVWDPHPSRAGLLGEVQWAFLVPYPQSWRGSTTGERPCVCPACAPRGEVAA